MLAGVAQSVQRLATDWTVRGQNSGRGEFSAPVKTGRGSHPASYTMGTCPFPGVKRTGRGFNHPSHMLKKAKNYTSIHLLSLNGRVQDDHFIIILIYNTLVVLYHLILRIYIYIYIYIYIFKPLQLYKCMYNAYLYSRTRL